MEYTLPFPSGTTSYYLERSFSEIDEAILGRKVVFITDENVQRLYPEYFVRYATIVIPAGESHKNWSTVQTITEQLVEMEADRKTLIIGIGGGVITDIAGFVASIYMRGVPFGFVPTTLLAMVDAAIGGKNGINHDLYKNMLGCIKQPEFIFYDASFLDSLAYEEWSNGFAEIVKYGCIFDAKLFSELTDHNIDFYRSNPDQLRAVVKRCVDWKNKTVLEDEGEKGLRKLLNFGHTVGHAIENRVQLSHGYAISIGMVVACIVSESVAALRPEMTAMLKTILQQYHLPTQSTSSPYEIMEVLRMDKKRNEADIDFVVLEKIGKAAVKTISFNTVQQALISYSDAGSH